MSLFGRSNKRKHGAREREDFDALPWEHQKRLGKLQTDQFYLLSSSVGAKDKSLCFDVSGSTGNVYRVDLPARGKRFSCNCPDASSHARRHNVECKHVLFVVYRVLRSSLSSQHFQPHRSRCIDDRQFDEWVERAQLMQTLLLSNDGASNHEYSDIINKEYRDRFLHAGDDQSKAEFRKPPGVVSASDFRGRCGDEDCPICFMPILESDADDVALRTKETLGKKQKPAPIEAHVSKDSAENMLVQCSTCLRALHRECADQWIDVGRNQTCVYCRSSLAYARWRDRSTKKNTDDATTSASAYFNVAL